MLRGKHAEGNYYDGLNDPRFGLHLATIQILLPVLRLKLCYWDELKILRAFSALSAVTFLFSFLFSYCHIYSEKF